MTLQHRPSVNVRGTVHFCIAPLIPLKYIISDMYLFTVFYTGWYRKLVLGLVKYYIVMQLLAISTSAFDSKYNMTQSNLELHWVWHHYNWTMLTTVTKDNSIIHDVMGLLSRKRTYIIRMIKWPVKSFFLVDVIKCKHFLRYWPFVKEIHRSPVDSSHKGQWRRALICSLICAWTNRWANNRNVDEFRLNHTRYDVTVTPVWHRVHCMKIIMSIQFTAAKP